jgi:hypothetical protein
MLTDVLFMIINCLWDVPIFGAHCFRLMANATDQRREVNPNLNRACGSRLLDLDARLPL